MQQRRSITAAGGATISISPAEVDSTAVVIGLAEAKVRKVNMPTMDRRSMLMKRMMTRLTLIQVKRCI